MIQQGRWVGEADLTNKAIEADKANANEAEDMDKAIDCNEAKVNEANEADVQQL